MCFPRLVALQPLAWSPTGLVCAPALGDTEIDLADLNGVVEVTPMPVVPNAWPDFPARMMAGWYVRSAHHAPAPPGLDELVVADGQAFGPFGHITTAMCLEVLATLPANG